MTLPKADAWKYFDNPKNHISIADTSIQDEIDEWHDGKLDRYRRGRRSMPSTRTDDAAPEDGRGEAVLDGRTRVYQDDWEWSWVAMGVSKLTRQWAMDAIGWAREREAVEKGRIYGVQRSAADDAHGDAEQAKATRVNSKVVEFLRAAGTGGLTESQVERSSTVATGCASAGRASWSWA